MPDSCGIAQSARSTRATLSLSGGLSVRHSSSKAEALCRPEGSGAMAAQSAASNCSSDQHRENYQPTNPPAGPMG